MTPPFSESQKVVNLPLFPPPLPLSISDKSLSKCDFSRLFHTEKSWHAYGFSVVFEFLVGILTLWCKNSFFELFQSVKLFIVAQ